MLRTPRARRYPCYSAARLPTSLLSSPPRGLREVKIGWIRLFLLMASPSPSHVSHLKRNLVIRLPKVAQEPVQIIDYECSGDFVKLDLRGTQSRKVYEAITLPLSEVEAACKNSLSLDFTGDAELFYLAMEAYRIRHAAQFDPLLAVNISQVDPLPHQIQAVYYHLLPSPRGRFLLADDPGAGKTIMAGLYLKELKYRRLVERILIVVPGHLKDQWRREMQERFQEPFFILDRGAESSYLPWEEYSQIITSIDYAKQPAVRNKLERLSWDLVIVDEAHKMAAYRYGDKQERTERYRLGSLLADRTRYLLLMTATPHRGDPENFRYLLQLLDPAFFSSPSSIEQLLRSSENQFFLRRLKEDLIDFEGRPLFPPRHVKTCAYKLSEPEMVLYEQVTEYVRNSYDKAMDKNRRNVAFAMLILQRRLASSVRAVRSSLERRKARLEELRRDPKPLSAERAEPFSEESLEDLPEAERLQEEERLLRLTLAENRSELEQEIQELDHLIQLAREAEAQEMETKLRELKNLMEAHPIQVGGEKLLIFTESRETSDYLAEKLRKWGYSVVTLDGTMSMEERVVAEKQFRTQAQVMISTEAGGEGINLQFCAVMVNYDIPWTPIRLEQRMGRIHRYGQTKEVYIYNLVASNTREGAVLQTLLAKLEATRQALGSDRVFDVIGEIVEEKKLKELIVEAIRNRKTLQELTQPLAGPEIVSRIQKEVERALQSGLATRHMNPTHLKKRHHEAQEHRLLPEYIEQFFQRACKYLKLPVTQDIQGIWHLPETFKERLAPHLRGAKALSNSFPLRCTFRKEQARREEVEFLAPSHPLFEALLDKILHKASGELPKGATFEDPDGRWAGWLFFYEIRVLEGAHKTLGERLVAVFLSETGEARAVSPAILWDLVPHPTSDPSPPPPTSKSAEEVASQALHAYFKEIQAERERYRELLQTQALYPLQAQQNELSLKLAELDDELKYGKMLRDEYEKKCKKIEKQKKEVEDTIRRIEEEIQKLSNTLSQGPRLVAMARVVPKSDPLHSDAHIEALGMQYVLQYERQEGREPEDVSAQNLGYDIRSTAKDGSVRYIEVKARATTGDIVLTPNEWRTAKEEGTKYWLYIVEHAGSAEPRLYCISNPAKRLHPRKVQEVVRF